MKKLSLILSICLTLLCLFALTSCTDRLPAPPELKLNVETQTMEWKQIKNAAYYTIKITCDGEADQEFTTLAPAFSLEFLSPGVYTVNVKANGDGKNFNDSKWVKKEYERYPESGLKYELINNDREYQLVGGGTASGNVVMESIYRDKPVTSIADKALYNNVKITGFTVGDNVKTIGEKAFTKCSKLEYIVVPDGVTEIGEYAFQSCKVLKSVSLPDTITSIPAHTFAWCSTLKDVNVGNAITSIGEYAFSNCTALENITYNGLAEEPAYTVNLPATLKSIAQYAFTDCSTLPSADLGGVETIALGAFTNCYGLTKVNLGESLISLDQSVFDSCTSLIAVRVPDSTETIASGCFYGCTSLADVSLGTGLKDIGSLVFESTAILEAATDMLIIDGWLIELKPTNKIFTAPDGLYGIASYASAQNALIEQLFLDGVKYISEAAFYGCENLYKVDLGTEMIEIGTAAFYSCKLISRLELGDTLEKVGDYAFFDCEKVGTEKAFPVELPDTVTSVGTQAFRNTNIYKTVNDSKDKGIVYIGAWAVDFITPSNVYNPVIINEGTIGLANYLFSYQSLLQVVLADSVEYIGRGSFYASMVVSVKLSESLKYIGDYAFYDCYITNFGGETYDLVIPGNTISIGRSAFYGCESILSLEIPGSVDTIGDYAFFKCLNIGNTVDLEITSGGDPTIESVTGYLTLHEGIKTIGNRAFQNCATLVDLTIPDSVTEIGIRAFFGCNALENVTIGGGVEELTDYMFYNCTALKNVVLSDGVKKVGNYAFRGCTSLSYIHLGNVESIGRYAFYGCSAIRNIDIPETVTAIGDYAFRGCTELYIIKIPASVEKIGKHTFYGLNTMTLYSESTTKPEGWDSKFNSSFRPLVLGYTLSDDGSYVVSIKSNIENAQAINGVANPTRKGYDFAGWTTVQGGTEAEFTSETLHTADADLTLYAIWVAHTEQ